MATTPLRGNEAFPPVQTEICINTTLGKLTQRVFPVTTLGQVLEEMRHEVPDLIRDDPAPPPSGSGQPVAARCRALRSRSTRSLHNAGPSRSSTSRPFHKLHSSDASLEKLLKDTTMNTVSLMLCPFLITCRLFLILEKEME